MSTYENMATSILRMRTELKSKKRIVAGAVMCALLTAAVWYMVPTAAEGC